MMEGVTDAFVFGAVTGYIAYQSLGSNKTAGLYLTRKYDRLFSVLESEKTEEGYTISASKKRGS